MSKEWFLIGEGRQRLAYVKTLDNPSFIVKIPKDEDGLHSNWEESRVFKKLGREGCNGINYARCRPLNNYFLIMEYCNVHVPIKELPGWSSYVDCCQVGLARDGKFVCYDYGF